MRVLTCLGGIFDFAIKKDRLKEVELELAEPSAWDDPQNAQALGRERAALEIVVSTIEALDSGCDDASDLLELAVEEDDPETAQSVEQDLAGLETSLEQLEFRRMFSGETDPNNAYLDIQAGSGGTEAQDWSEMLLRMYLRWGEDKGFKTTLLEASAGEVAGLKSATIQFEGDYAFGWLRTETGVHRLVRKSPFDSGNRRHTSFASVFVYPDIDREIEIDIDESELPSWFNDVQETTQLTSEELYSEQQISQHLTEDEVKQLEGTAFVAIEESIDELIGALKVESNSNNKSSLPGTLNIDTDELLSQLDDAIENMAMMPEQSILDELNKSIEEVEVPVANAGGDQRVTAQDDGTAIITLDGSSSYDPQSRIKVWSWIDSTGREISDIAKLKVKLKLGKYQFELRICDVDGNWNSDYVIIIVEE